MIKALTIIQARSGSSRLRNKVLLPLGEGTVLSYMLSRVKQSTSIDKLLVATTTLPEDDVVFEETRSHGVECFRGHPTDLLDRHFRAAENYAADIVVKIPSDCPLIDPKVIDSVITFMKVCNGQYDYLSNLHPQSFPDGNDVEVMTNEVLEIAFREAKKDYEREHTTPFVWDQPDRFRIGNVALTTDYSQNFRWVLDYYEDYLLIKDIVRELHADKAFGYAEIISLLESNPTLYNTNKKFLGDAWYTRQSHGLKTINALAKISN